MLKRFAFFTVASAFVAQFSVACSSQSANEPTKAAVVKPQTATTTDPNAEDQNAINAANQQALLNAQFQFVAVHFGYDSTELDGASRKSLDGAAEYLAKNRDLIVTISGHADERGTSEYNLALGENRAKAVKKYLATMGVTPERLETISFGELQPVAKDGTEDGFAQNRRAEFKVDNKAKR